MKEPSKVTVSDSKVVDLPMTDTAYSICKNGVTGQWEVYGVLFNPSVKESGEVKVLASSTERQEAIEKFKIEVAKTLL